MVTLRGFRLSPHLLDLPVAGRPMVLRRTAGLLQALEVGTCRPAGHFPTFEVAAVTWQAGQHQPDGLAALVVAHDVLVHTAGRQMHVAIPDLTAKLSDGASVGRGNPLFSRRLDECAGTTPIIGT